MTSTLGPTDPWYQERSPALVLASTTGPDAEGSASGPVGRTAERARLQALVDQAIGGRPTLVVVHGPEGMGKSSLVSAVLADVHPLTVVEAVGTAWERTHPYELVRQIAGDLAHLGGTDETVRAATDQLSATTQSGDANPMLVGVALAALMTAVVRQGRLTLAVVVEDAHFGDDASLRALSSAIRRLRGMPVILVAVSTWYPLAGHLPGLADLVAAHRGTTIELSGLDTADVQRLAATLGVSLSAFAARRLRDHTGGSPRYVSEILTQHDVHQWESPSALLPTPGSMRAQARRLMAKLEPGPRDIVEAAAVLGDWCLFDDLVQVAGVDDPVAALDVARRRGLLELQERDHRTWVGFPVPLARAAVYQDLDMSRRQQLHLRAAETLVDEASTLLHRVAATPSADAALSGVLEEFAERRAAVGAWAQAGEALVIASRLSPHIERRQVLLMRAMDALTGAGDLMHAKALSPEVESLPETAEREAVLGYLALLQGHRGAARYHLERAWASHDDEADPALAAKIAQRWALHGLADWDCASLVAWAERAVRTARNDEPTVIEAQSILGVGLAGTGRIEQAQALCGELPRRVPVGAQTQRALLGKGWVDVALDDLAVGRRELETAAPTAYWLGSSRISLWAHALLARTQLDMGDWDEALATVARGLRLLDTNGIELLRPLLLWTAVHIHAMRGEHEQALALLAPLKVDTSDYIVMMVPAALARAQVAEAQADYEGVLRALEPVLERNRTGGLDEPGFWPWQDVWANALVMTGRADQADTFLAPLERVAAQRGHRSTRSRLGYARGRVHGARGDLERARTSFEQALADIEDLPLPYQRARVNFAYGQTLRRVGKRREADTVLTRARDGFAQLGATAYTQRCDRELKAGGVATRRDATDLAALTAQEQAVSRLVAGGMSNREVATELFISVKTVQYHLTRIYVKLGVRTRAELAARFRDVEFD